MIRNYFKVVQNLMFVPKTIVGLALLEISF